VHPHLRFSADLVVSDLSELPLDVLEARFREQAEARAQRESAMLVQEAWRIEQEGFDPAREHEMESLFTIGNGYLGVRGALDTPLPGSRADLFSAAGLVLDAEAAARLPQDCQSVELQLTFRGQRYPVRVARQEQTS
jgi:trehalose/maltose hydrolase-like predicted phosphorylase